MNLTAYSVLIPSNWRYMASDILCQVFCFKRDTKNLIPGNTDWSDPKNIAGIYIGGRLELAFYLMHVFLENIFIFYASLSNWDNIGNLSSQLKLIRFLLYCKVSDLLEIDQ